MQISISDLHKVLNDFLIRVIVPKLPNDFYKFGLSFAANYISEQTISQIFSKYSEIISKLGIVKDGMIDIDILRENALKALKACQNNSFIVMNYKVDMDDIDELYKIMAMYAKS